MKTIICCLMAFVTMFAMPTAMAQSSALKAPAKGAAVIGGNHTKSESGTVKVFVGGEVRQPGQVPLGENMRLLDAVALTGGFTEFAMMRSVKLIRGKKETKYDLRQMKKDGSNNPLLQDGDQIIVPG